MENEQLTEEQLYYKDKYLKYKLKYVTLKKQLGGFAGFSRQNKLEGAIADTPSNLLSFGKNLKNAADIEMGNRKRIADEKQRKIDQDKARAGASAANNEKKMEIHDKVKDKIIKEINNILDGQKSYDFQQKRDVILINNPCKGKVYGKRPCNEIIIELIKEELNKTQYDLSSERQIRDWLEDPLQKAKTAGHINSVSTLKNYLLAEINNPDPKKGIKLMSYIK
jgi:hypothetical protein